MTNAELFSLEGKVAVVTGGTGALGSALAQGLAAAGARVGVLGRRAAHADRIVAAITQSGGSGLALVTDVFDSIQLNQARDKLLNTWGTIDILLNATGGNLPGATVGDDRPFFSLSEEALNEVVRLNLNSAIRTTQVFGEVMAQRGAGSIINISSMASQKPLTRVVGYAAAKAAIENFTKWLAVELAQKYGPGLRVNAIAPGFFIGEQNRDLLLNADGTHTPRGRLIIEHTPLRRFGQPEELIGAAVWLASDAARFVTGIVVPVDGGFSAFGGV
jgi:NAD(P)-dependent dehydrogenase (short-subunit alcohol dehydrogenase family)